MQSVWTTNDIDKFRSDVRERKMQFTYPNGPIYEALDRWGDIAVRGKRGLVIGSETPWLESMLLEYGTANLSTLEFGEIQTTHPQLTTFTPQEFTLKFLQGKIAPFDFAISYSSIEHDGLGRYGDVLNPIGDLQTMARMLSVVKPGGFMFLGVPCCEDALYWNAHRVYGPMRFTEMFAGWRTLGSAPRDALEGSRGGKNDWMFQPVWAIQNRMGCRGGVRVADVRKVVDAFI
ncbi:DUF268-domain-containing protein [Ramaria rubella]|nr:DUF268-domain-containing protein [Ramaria rubella]